MCGRLFQTSPPKRLAELFGTANPLVNAPPRYNAAPTDALLTVRRNPKTGERALDPLRWGLIPYWAADSKRGAALANARAETVAVKPSFRDAFARRRCIVPADGFYEWYRPGTGAASGAKQPYAFAHPANEAGERPPLALAALWEAWRDPAGDILRTVTLVTTTANAVMAPVHDRMPVILAPEDWALWLGERPGDVAALMRPCAEALLDHWPVSPAVGNVRNQGAGLTLPLGSVPSASVPSAPVPLAPVPLASVLSASGR